MARVDDTTIQGNPPAAGGGQAFAQILYAADASTLMVADANLLLKGDFSRAGADLIVTGPDGTQLLIVDYFSSLAPPALETPGGAVIAPDLVSALAGPLAPGQYVQEGDGIEAEAIGVVETLQGGVTAARVDGTQVTLSEGSPVFQGDVLETAEDSAVGLVFADASTFSLGDEGRMVLDELIYDPTSQEGSSLFSVVQGVFVFVSGEIATNNPGDMEIRTPVATLGVRGTKVGGRGDQEGELNTITLLPDEDGSVGQLEVYNASGRVVLDSAFATTAVSSVFEAPSDYVNLSEAQAEALFGTVSRALPRVDANLDSADGRSEAEAEEGAELEEG